MAKATEVSEQEYDLALLELNRVLKVETQLFPNGDELHKGEEGIFALKCEGHFIVYY